MSTKTIRALSSVVTFLGFLYFFFSMLKEELLIVETRLRGGSLAITAIAAIIFFIGFVVNFSKLIKGQ